jgi:DNA-binding response OmpR family regulator
VIEPDAASEDATVLVDRDRLIQVLTNLLSNAAKFSPREATVAVRIRTEPDSVRVEVRDQGPGIAPAFQKRIFQKFAQGDCADSRQKDGTGLGLSISKTLIEQLGGSIGFSSEPGKGATFFFTLPRHRVPVRDAASSNGKFAGHRVLLCEDDPDVAEGLHALLTSSGIRVELASSAQAARAVLEKERVDMAVIDVDLPDADGIEFIAELRSRLATRNLPIVVSTAHARASIAEQRLAELNVTHWLEKSGDPQQLAEAIHESLGNARLARAAVLHVEDDESLTEVVQEAIGDQFDIVTAHTLAEARERLRERQYDALILDIGLADGSGLDLLPELSGQNGRPTPVVLYSATEVSKELATKVELALVKSRHSVTQVLRALRKLAA